MIQKKDNTIKDMKSTSPLISVIVPIYNVEKFLPRCIESIIGQTYSNLEIILIDDESPDNCGAICDTYAEKDARIIVIHQKNTELSGARNSGLDIATGEFISFVDSDDWMEPNMLQIMLVFALKNKLDVVECGSLKSTKKRDNQDYSSGIIETNEEALERIIENQTFSVWRRIIHKNIIGDLRFIPYKLHQDVFFTIDILKKVKHHGYIKSPLINYNVENVSIIRSSYSQKKLDAIDATFYVINETKGYNKNVRIQAKRHVIQQLMGHYNELYFHSYLDSDYKVRTMIRKEISKVLSPGSWSVYGILIKYLPFKVYGIFVRLNRYRISIQVYILKMLGR